MNTNGNYDKVAVAVIEKQGKVLIARRQKDDPLRGKWEFPGGKIEDGETPEECLKRELMEELGVEGAVKGIIGSTSYQYDHVPVDLSYYHVELLSGNIYLKEYQEIQWVYPRDLESYDFPEANMPVIRKLIKGALSRAKVQKGKRAKGRELL